MDCLFDCLRKTHLPIHFGFERATLARRAGVLRQLRPAECSISVICPCYQAKVRTKELRWPGPWSARMFSLFPGQRRMHYTQRFAAESRGHLV